MGQPFTVICATVSLLALTACGDPLADVPKLSEVELAEDAPVTELASSDPDPEAPVARPGLLSGLFGGTTQPKPENAPEPTDRAEGGAPAAVLASAPAENAVEDVPDSVETPAKRGFLGLFDARPDRATKPEPSTEVAALPQPVEDKPAVTDAAPRRGLFGASRAAKPAARKSQPPSVPPGTLLSFGLVKPVCDLPRAKRGKETGAFPERGKTWRLYDSDPGKTTSHPFYITGFDDGCARTFTAAVAVFGAPQMHELLRYGLPAKVQPYSETDKVYEKIKRRVCKVGQGKPCGTKIRQLEKNTVFVSAYEKYGNNGTWFNMLLHDGELAATDLKSGG